MLPQKLGWWNGRHVRLRGVCRKACGFKSRPEHFVWQISEAEVGSLPQTWRGLSSPFVANVYLELTKQFNAGRLRAIISSGQAVVLHRPAILSNWMAGGWSAHFEFRTQQLRIRTDFVTRPPRLDGASLAGLWKLDPRRPVLGLTALAEIKKNQS